MEKPTTTTAAPPLAVPPAVVAAVNATVATLGLCRFCASPATTRYRSPVAGDVSVCAAPSCIDRALWATREDYTR